MSLTDSTFNRKVGDEEEETRGNQIKKLPAYMQSFDQTIYFNFMITIDKIFPDDDEYMANSGIYLGYKHNGDNIFENTFLIKTEAKFMENFQFKFEPIFEKS